jgi:hypothetical protein
MKENIISLIIYQIYSYIYTAYEVGWGAPHLLISGAQFHVFQVLHIYVLFRFIF